MKNGILAIAAGFAVAAGAVRAEVIGTAPSSGTVTYVGYPVGAIATLDVEVYADNGSVLYLNGPVLGTAGFSTTSAIGAPAAAALLTGGKAYVVYWIALTNGEHGGHGDLGKSNITFAPPNIPIDLHGAATLTTLTFAVNSSSLDIQTRPGGLSDAIITTDELVTISGTLKTAAGLAQAAKDALDGIPTARWTGPNGNAQAAKKSAASTQLQTAINFLAIAADVNETSASRCGAYQDAIDILNKLIVKSGGGNGSWTNDPALVQALQDAVDAAISDETALHC